MKKKLGICIPLSDEEYKKVEEYCDITYIETNDMSEEDLCDKLSGNEIIVTMGEYAGKTTIDKWADNGLGFLINARGTPTMVDWQALHDRGIPLGHCPGKMCIRDSSMDSGSAFILGMSPKNERKNIFEQVGVQFQETNYPDKIKIWELCEETESLYNDTKDYNILLKEFGLYEMCIRDRYYR